MGVSLLDTTGPMKQPTPMAANKRPSVVELSPKLCMLGKVLNRTCAAYCGLREMPGEGPNVSLGIGASINISTN